MTQPEMTQPDTTQPARPPRAAFVLLVAAVVVAPWALYSVLVMKVLCFALFASAFNLLIGYAGLLSLGHAAFFGAGAYAAAYAARSWNLSAELAIALGGGIGAALGAPFGWVAIRRQGIYFAMITLALAQMVYFFCVQAAFTGGEDGIQQVPRAPLLGVLKLTDDRAMYALVAAIFLAGFALIYRVVHSPFGQVLAAIRQNEARAISLGYRVDRYKLLAFVLSAALAGVAGATKALVFGIATLTDVHWTMSGEIVLMTLLGGMGTIFGPLAGAVLVIALEYYLASFGAWVTVIQGGIFVACVLAFRRGLVGELDARLRLSL